jgi:chorismate mutase/ubiquinone/menaquinone biosynthesis C-methylase UbiE
MNTQTQSILSDQSQTQVDDERLQNIGDDIDASDRQLIHLLAKRCRMSEEVIMIKLEKKLEIKNKEREDRRLNSVRKWAKEEGVNPDFAYNILEEIIKESCDIQEKIKRQFEASGLFERFNPSHDELSANLIALTQQCAPTYEHDYEQQRPATKALREYERTMIDVAVEQAPDRKLAVDLGCATGIESRRLLSQFECVQGFDISTHMVKVGREILAQSDIKNVKLDVCDIEKGLELADNSVSLIVMNEGTGSDVFEFGALLREIRRVLKPHGTFVISFYNKEAWGQRMFFPWPSGLAADVDLNRNCLEVDFKNKKFAIHAKAYSVSEIEEIFDRNKMVLLSCTTYPTISAILPKEMVEPRNSKGEPIQLEITSMIKSLDKVIARGTEPLGAYIIVSGRKE